MPKKRPAQRKPEATQPQATKTRPQASQPQATPQATALSIEQLALLLSRAGGQEITTEAIRQDIAAGAPVNADGTMHFTHYAAWLAAQAD